MNTLEKGLMLENEKLVATGLNKLAAVLPDSQTEPVKFACFYSSRLFMVLAKGVSITNPGLFKAYLHILLAFIKHNKEISKYFSENTDFISALFSCLKKKIHVEYIVAILEEIVVNSNAVVSMSAFDNLLHVYNKLNSEQIIQLSKLFALISYDYKKVDFSLIFKVNT